MSIVKNKVRVANFSSSEIFKLIDLGTRQMTEAEKDAHKKLFPKSQKRTIEDPSLFSSAGLNYIKAKNQEQKRKRSLSLDIDPRSADWGKVMERRVFDLVGLEYSITSQVTKQHPIIKRWVGSPDMIVPNVKVSEIKC